MSCIGIMTTIMLALFIIENANAGNKLQIGWKADRSIFADAWGVDPLQMHNQFSKNKNLQINLIQTNIPANIMWPKDKAELVFQIKNLTDTPLNIKGYFDIDKQAAVESKKKSSLGITVLKKLADIEHIPFSITIPPKLYKNITINPVIPESFGGYVIIVDIEKQGRFFGAGLARVRKNVFPKTLYRRFTMDAISTKQMQRLAAYPNRIGMNWRPVTDKDFEEWYKTDRRMKKLKEYQDAEMTVTVEFGHCIDPTGPRSPMGVVRPHLDENGVMLKTKSDYAWMPKFDKEFEEYVYRLCCDYGYPKGPINGVMLWNEPWEGMSISGWGADLPRYREIYSAMARGVERARKEAGVDVLIGGCDSTSNTLDKLFPQNDEWLKWLDFVSIHYQTNSPSSTLKKFINRKYNKGRVMIWDTESWVTNIEGGVSAMVAACSSFGYDRIVGIYGGGTINVLEVEKMGEDGKIEKIKMEHAWPINAAIAASQSFIGERPFKELLFKNGLPWILVFDGNKTAAGKINPDDGTIVVIGDIAQTFRGKANNFPFRNVRSLDEVANEEKLEAELAALPLDDANTRTRKKLKEAILKYDPITNASLKLADPEGKFRLYGIYGNEIPATNGYLEIPLTQEGYFFRTDGSAGSFAKLIEQMKKAEIKGLEPIDVICRDMLSPVGKDAVLKLELTNILNRPINGKLDLKLTDLKIEAPGELSFKPHETKKLDVKIKGGKQRADNTYPLSFVFDAGKDGRAVHKENMHVNLIHKRSVNVDGKLDDWKDTLPQPLEISGEVSATLQELAWHPYEKMPDSVKTGFATTYLAYDDDYFYFAARIADETPDEGTIRFEERDDDVFYYPEKSFSYDTSKSFQVKKVIGEGKPDNKTHLQHPTINGKRLNGQWQYKLPITSFAIDVDVPENKPQLVTLFLPPWHSHNAYILVTDRETNKRYEKMTLKGEENYNGLYLSFLAKGKMRFKISGPPWRQVAVSGIFFDPAKTATKVGKCANKDYDTKGDWKEKYGKNGYEIIGTEPKWPKNVKVATPENIIKKEHVWPAGVRRYSYRKRPTLPFGGGFDNVQIAFNSIPAGDPEGIGGEWEMEAYPKGTRWQYTNYKCSDYEYALNKVNAKYGGGTEIFRLTTPGLPHKHFYPRQPKHPLEGAVKDGKLLVKHDGNTRIVECAIPWSEIPLVKKLCDAGKPVKFTCRINSKGIKTCMELARERSVSKHNESFHADWEEHWANEVEFAFEK